MSKKIIKTEYLNDTLEQVEKFIRTEMDLNSDYLGYQANIIIEVIKE